MGWASTQLSTLSREFVAFSSHAPGPVLDLGGAPGIAAAAALAAGAAAVIANDLDGAFFTAIEPDPRLTIKPGRFPRALHFEAETLGAIHASNVLHFLPPPQMEEGFRAFARWLRPGGKLFVQASSPYQTPFQAFIPEFERRREAGQRWPGWLEKASEFAAHRQMGQMPRSLHLLDDATLARAAAGVGLQVERAWLYRRADFPRTLHVEGSRETAALIAMKP